MYLPYINTYKFAEASVNILFISMHVGDTNKSDIDAYDDDIDDEVQKYRMQWVRPVDLFVHMRYRKMNSCGCERAILMVVMMVVLVM